MMSKLDYRHCWSCIHCNILLDICKIKWSNIVFPRMKAMICSKYSNRHTKEHLHKHYLYFGGVAMNSEELISLIVNHPDSIDITCQLLDVLSKRSYKAGQQFLDHIGKISSNMISNVLENSCKYKEAADWAIIQQSLTADKRTRLYTMLPICQVCFPDGNADKCCEAQKRYFKEFVNLLKDRKLFDMSKDKEWADSYGYTEYIQKVIQNNT